MILLIFTLGCVGAKVSKDNSVSDTKSSINSDENVPSVSEGIQKENFIRKSPSSLVPESLGNSADMDISGGSEIDNMSKQLEGY